MTWDGGSPAEPFDWIPPDVPMHHQWTCPECGSHARPAYIPADNPDDDDTILRCPDCGHEDTDESEWEEDR